VDPLFCPLYVSLRALHSCPARRSSDLRAIPHGPARLTVDDAPFGAGHILHDLVGAGEYAGVDDRRQRSAPLAERDGIVIRLSHLDRKSTRLNSSHVKISYAVFCLKKKN